MSDVGLGRCDGERQAAEGVCTRAATQRRAADRTRAAWSAATRALDEAAARLREARLTTAPASVAEEKDAAQLAFRATELAATSSEDQARATAAWLDEIDRINRRVRDASAVARLEEARVASLTREIDRLARLADEAAASADEATASCQLAREALAECEEALARVTLRSTLAPGSGSAADEPARGGASGATSDAASAAPRDPGAAAAPRAAGESEPGAARLANGRETVIDRLLRGDRETLRDATAALAANDTDDRRRYQLLLVELVDSVIHAAIDATFLDFSAAHPFWREFAPDEQRLVAAYLASIGHRVDARRAFATEDAPALTRRELVLAVTYAGIDPLRVRHWPADEELGEVYSGVTVAAHDLVATRAANLSLAEMVALVGRRADALAELWDRWGRVRPLLLSAADRVPSAVRGDRAGREGG